MPNKKRILVPVYVYEDDKDRIRQSKQRLIDLDGGNLSLGDVIREGQKLLEDNINKRKSNG